MRTPLKTLLVQAMLGILGNTRALEVWQMLGTVSRWFALSLLQIAYGVLGHGDRVPRLVLEAHRVVLGQFINKLKTEAEHALEDQQ